MVLVEEWGDRLPGKADQQNAGFSIKNANDDLTDKRSGWSYIQKHYVSDRRPKSVVGELPNAAHSVAQAKSRSELKGESTADAG
jgi:hypothetical protein